MADTSDATARTPWRSGTLIRRGRARVLFGWSYEDERIELEAFARPAGGRVCVIAAAGETAAACAAAEHEVTAVDINPRQLDYCRRRLAGATAQAGLAETGMNAGRSALGLVAPAWRQAALVAALGAVEPDVAEAYWRERLDHGAFPVLLRSLVGSGGVALRGLNPALARAVPPRFDRVVRARIGHGLGRHGFAANRFAWRLLAGVDLPGWTMPTVTAADPPVELIQADVAEHLESVPPGHYAGVSLSNVLDGADSRFATRLRTAATRALAPGGAIVLRSFGDGADPGCALDDAALLWGSVQVLRPTGPG